MSEAYYVAGSTPGWTVVDNWYLDPGDNKYGPTSLGRLPTTSDSVILCGGAIDSVPGGTWTGPVRVTSGYIDGGSFTDVVLDGGYITSGSFSGKFLLRQGWITGGTFSVNLMYDPYSAYYTLVSGGTLLGVDRVANEYYTHAVIISGGTWTGTVELGPKCIISGGTFTGTVIGNRTTAIEYGFNTEIGPQFRGGTYSPTVSTPISIQRVGGVWKPVTASLPVDPGFAAGGGVFDPVITVAGVPSVLLNQLL
jgi:hypothetical protein